MKGLKCIKGHSSLRYPEPILNRVLQASNYVLLNLLKILPLRKLDIFVIYVNAYYTYTLCLENYVYSVVILLYYYWLFLYITLVLLADFITFGYGVWGDRLCTYIYLLNKNYFGL